MKTARIVALVATLALATSACTHDTTTSASGNTGFSPAEQRFLADMHQGADWTGTSDADLVSSGHGTCTGLDGGETLDDIATYLNNAHASTSQASAMIVSSITDLCPKYTQQLNAWMNSSGGG